MSIKLHINPVVQSTILKLVIVLAYYQRKSHLDHFQRAVEKAFEDGKPLTFTYKLKVDNNKFKTALEENNKKKRTKRSTPTENENSVTEKIISNTTTYEINEQKLKGTNLVMLV